MINWSTGSRNQDRRDLAQQRAVQPQDRRTAAAQNAINDTLVHPSNNLIPARREITNLQFHNFPGLVTSYPITLEGNRPYTPPPNSQKQAKITGVDGISVRTIDDRGETERWNVPNLGRDILKVGEGVLIESTSFLPYRITMRKTENVVHANGGINFIPSTPRNN